MEKSNSDGLQLNGLHVNTEKCIVLFKQCWKGHDFPVEESANRRISTPILKNKVPAISINCNEKTFKHLLESRAIDFEAACICFQQKLRIRFILMKSKFNESLLLYALTKILAFILKWRWKMVMTVLCNVCIKKHRMCLSVYLFIALFASSTLW